MKKPFLKISKVLLALPVGCLLLLNACKKDQAAPASTTAEESKTSARALTYQLVWSDEFNGTSVNTSNWKFETGGGGWGNNEKQYYQASNATVANGELTITARKQTVGNNPYTSARMITSGLREFQYGRIEARMRLPMGQGLWPAFWMLGANFGSVGWPSCGEIDIMEHVNNEANTHGTIHWNGPSGYASYGGSRATTPDQYHVYSIEWTPSAITWYVDGVQFHVANIANNVNSTEEFHRPFFLLLNLAVAGNWPGQTVDESRLPAAMNVDYVRVYQLREDGTNQGNITLRGANNLFVSSENGTAPMRCNRTTAQAWETFTVVDAGGGLVALRCISNSRYVSSENGTAPITCNRTTIGDWEKFTRINNSDGTVSFRGTNGRYISHEDGNPMTCNRTTIGAWEKFRLN